MQRNNKKILVIGTGYVGLVSGACFAELGHHITCVDNDKGKIHSLQEGIIPIYEKGLKEIVVNNHKTGKLNFSYDIEKEIEKADIIFIAVGTPPAKDGSADLSYINEVAENIAKNGKDGVIIVTKSTVPVGTGDKIKQLIKNTNPSLKFNVASNPEFLREGNAVKDFLHPDRVLIGADTDEIAEDIAALYRPIKDVNIVKSSIRTAEMTKYTANAYLAMRVAFINEIADICENTGADIEQVANAMGLDHRIGPHFLKTGPGFGGSCFPKDTQALHKIASDAGAPSKLIYAVIASNDKRKANMAEKISKASMGVRNKKIGILGIAFKANTDDIRDSSALVIIEELIKKGAEIIAYDPEAIENSKKYFAYLSSDKIKYAASTNEVLEKADTVAIVTEWQEFKKLDLGLLKGKTLVDLRNLYNPADVKRAGVKYYSLGRRPE